MEWRKRGARENILKYWEALETSNYLHGSLAVLLGSLPDDVGRRRSRTHRVSGRVGLAASRCGLEEMQNTRWNFFFLE